MKRLLKKSAQAACNYIVQAQDPAGGGWRYSPRTPGDTSVVGWQLMALKSGQMAGLSIPYECLKKAETFLNSCESQNKGGYDVQVAGVRAFCPGSQIDVRRGDPAALGRPRCLPGRSDRHHCERET